VQIPLLYPQMKGIVIELVITWWKMGISFLIIGSIIMMLWAFLVMMYLIIMTITGTRKNFILYKGREIRLIGISGKIGTGKTTLANYLCKRYPSLTRVSFAENLRRMIAILVNVDIEKTRSANDKAVMLPGWGCSVGDLLQRFGTEVGRMIHPHAWVLSLFAGYKEGESFWVSDDTRFINECEGIKERGGLLIRLNGDPGKMYEEAGKVRNLNHASETALDEYDGFDVVINTEDYLNDMDKLFDAIFGNIDQ